MSERDGGVQRERAGVVVRPYERGDWDAWRRMRTALWPDQTEDDMRDWLAREDAVTVVALRADGSPCGFAEAATRPYADGCLTSPVAYLEGWWVDEGMRRRGVGRALVATVERWARARGLEELASDALLDNVTSQRAHERIGFEEVERLVVYRKPLGGSGRGVSTSD